MTYRSPSQRLPGSAAGSAGQKDDRPIGGLYTTTPDGDRSRFVLDRTDVKANIAGNLSRVEVTQVFTNPFDRPLEAIYVFPLPDEAAVDDMEIRIGDRVIKGNIKRREEAQAIYDEARRQGRTAGLLEQERDNIFTQSLANIKPGETIQVTLRYTESLKFEGGRYDFVFPMVVGPRYIPGQITTPEGDTNKVPDASRITPPVLRPGVRSGNDISLSLTINAGVPIGQITSPSHQITIDRPAEGGTVQTVHLAKGDTIPNKDFILRYQVAGEKTQATVLTQADDRGGHFALYLIPAVNYPERAIIAKDVVFLMDTSGSQQGAPLAQSKALMRRFLQQLNPDDTFTIVDFANTATRLSEQPLANTPANRQRALGYIEALQANGGTNLMEGIDAVMKFPAARGDRLRTFVLLTDGYIGNDREVIGEVQRRLQSGNRLFSFGVGSSVNRFLLDRLAEVGRGAVQIVRHDENPDPVADKFSRQVANPVLSQVTVSWQGPGPAPEIYPAAAPDLFAAQPLVIFGRKGDRQPGTLIVRGVAAGNQAYEQRFSIAFNDNQKPAVAQLWGRARIKDLMNQLYTEGQVKSLVDAVTNTALAYRLLSEYTAFVAVSEEVRVNPDGSSERVQVPVELPEGTNYNGFFGNGVDQAADRSMRSAGAPPPLSAPFPTTAQPMPGVRSRGPQNQVGDVGDTETARRQPEAEPNQPSQRLEVVSATGLSPAQTAALQDFLNRAIDQQGGLDTAIGGEFVFDLSLRNGRVTRVVFDDQASAGKLNASQVAALQSLIQAWPDAPAALGQTRLTLRIRS